MVLIGVGAVTCFCTAGFGLAVRFRLRNLSIFTWAGSALKTSLVFKETCVSGCLSDAFFSAAFRFSIIAEIIDQTMLRITMIEMPFIACQYTQILGSGSRSGPGSDPKA